MRSVRLATIAVGVMVTVPMAASAFAAPAPNLSKSQVQPWTFVGKAGACGVDYPAGSQDVDSKWSPHAGLLDVHGNADKALALSKTGLTSDCSSAGATITNVAGLAVTQLSFDISDDSHCGAGAPRFNVVTDDNVLHFVGCSSMTATTADGTDEAGNSWTHREADFSQAFPAITPGSTVKSIDIVFDEGTDQGTGQALLDNIEVNGTVVGH